MLPQTQNQPYVWTTGSTGDELLPEGATNDPIHPQEEERMARFKRVLDQIQIDSIPSLASKVRKANSAVDSGSSNDSNITSSSALIACKLVQPPLHGSYNIVFQILFDDGVRWMLKVPANGHRGSFNCLAAQALESEAQTMRLLKLKSSIPVPAVHSFDTSLDNQIGCPYILMDHISGKPLHHVWFDMGISCQKLKQIRARALQTIATSMAQLSLFKTARGGSLMFDQAGTPIDVGPAKAVDANVMFDRFEADGQENDNGTADAPEDDVFCEKGPSEDPLSSILFMLNRRGVRQKDSSFERGIRLCLRIFIQMMEKHRNREGDQFVLAHPDFDMQNMLVGDDGTLVGIIDWDGVAAVPQAVGALRFPNFLMRDWEPTFYNWNSEANGPQTYYGRNENSPAELAESRVMYAQFIEMAFRATGSTVAESKELACVTRASILIGSLEMAASDPLVTPAIMSHVFTQIMQAEDQYYDETSSTSSASSSSSVSGDDEASDISDASNDDDPLNDTVQEDTNKLRPRGDRETPCPRCIREGLRIAVTPPLDEGTQNQQEGQMRTLDMAFLSSSIPLEAPATSPIGLRKAGLPRFALDLGGKCCKRAAQPFYHEDSEPSDNPDFGVDPDYVNLQAHPMELQVEHVVHRLLKVLEPCSGSIRKILEWLQSKLGKLHDFIFPSPDDFHLASPESRMQCRQGEQTGISADQVLAHPSNEIEHVKGCAKAKKHALSDQTESEASQAGEVSAKDVWERIALEVRNCGITTPMLKGGQQMISAWIIDNLKEKAKREKEVEEGEKKAKRKVERKAAKARKREQILEWNGRNRGLAKEQEQDGAQLDSPSSAVGDPPELLSQTVQVEDDSHNHTNGRKLGTGSSMKAKANKDLAETPVFDTTDSGAVKENFKQLEAPTRKTSAPEITSILDGSDVTGSQTEHFDVHEPNLRPNESASSESEQFESTLGGQVSEVTQLAFMIADAFSDAVPDVAEASLVDVVEGRESLVRLPANPAVELALLRAARKPLAEAEGASMQLDLAWQAVDILASRYETNGRPNARGTRCECGSMQCSCRIEAGPSKEKHASSPNSASTTSESSLDEATSSHTSHDSIEVRNQEPSSPSNSIFQGRGVPAAAVDRSGEPGPIRESTRVLVDAAHPRGAEAVAPEQAPAINQPAVTESHRLGEMAGASPAFDETPPSGGQWRDQPRSEEGGDVDDAQKEAEEIDERGCSDHGGFNANDVCFALGKGKLDKERYGRLLRGIELLHSWTVGGW